MNPIKEFFKKRTFKKAGPGRKLNDSTSSAAASTHHQRHSHTSAPRVQSDASQQAAQAAIARLELKQKPDVNWSLSAVRAQARKELELEQQVSQKAKQEVKPVFQESCPVLAVSGVYFNCPLIGPYVLPYKEIVSKIKEFLYSQLKEERGLTACLIIQSCNKDKEKVRIAVETLSRYLTNIIDNPTEEKYRKIRMSNKAFQERVAPLEGTIDFILATGFIHQILIQEEDKEEEFFVFPEDRLDDLDNLQMLKEALHTAEVIRPSLDRNKKLLMPSQSSEKINLPGDFFNLSTDELLKEQEAKAQAVEINSQLRTKAMRVKDDIKEMRLYKYSLVRIRFPDGIILQGTFHVHEKLIAIKDFVVENLAQPEREYALLAPGGSILEDDMSTLLELKLIPAVLVNLKWTKADLGEEVAYLTPDTMCLLQNF